MEQKNGALGRRFFRGSTTFWPYFPAATAALVAWLPPRLRERKASSFV
jgi:hypothetical protein